MCRHIETRVDFDHPLTDDEVRAESMQFVRKTSRLARPSVADPGALNRTVDDVARIARDVVGRLGNTGPTRSRAIEAAKVRARALRRIAAP